MENKNKSRFVLIIANSDLEQTANKKFFFYFTYSNY